MRYPLIFLLLCLYACGPADSPPVDILALGHIYRWDDSNDRVDPRIAALRRDTFEQLWLLGDLLGRTDETARNYNYLDSLFALHTKRTIWVEGNHDVNTGNVKTHPLKPMPFERRYIDGLEMWRLNTNLFTWPGGDIPKTTCRLANAQYDSLRAWADQLPTDATNLVVLHHQAVLTNAQYPGKPLNKVWNYYNDQLNVRCSPLGTFTDWYLPLFEEIQTRGTQVTFIGGDIGQRVKTFEYMASNGIHYLATGINNSMDPRYPPRYVTSLAPDSILTLRYFPDTDELTHRFLPLGGESAAYHSIWDKLK